MKHLPHIIVLLVAALCLTSFAQESVSCQLELKKGWYAYALDFVPDTDSMASLRGMSKIYVWRDGRFKELSTDDTLGVGEGFFMKVTDEERSPLTLTGATGTAADLAKGWNLCSKGRVPADETYYMALDLEHRSYVQNPTVTANQAVWVNIEGVYLVVNLENFTYRYTDAAPDISQDTCKTTELWLRHIPAGSFMMGSPENEVGRVASCETQHQVTLTEDYYIGIFEMTQKQYKLAVSNLPVKWLPSYKKNSDEPSYWTGDCRPVESVSYADIRGASSAQGAGWPTYGHTVDEGTVLSELRDRTGLLFDLPTEAQWEYACRAGTTTSVNIGEDISNIETDPAMDKVARYHASYTYHVNVGGYLPNAWGLYDMHGNVYEWCLDWFVANADGTTDPVGPKTADNRIMRGGGYVEDARYCRSAYRSSKNPSQHADYLGFRVVMLPNVTP